MNRSLLSLAACISILPLTLIAKETNATPPSPPPAYDADLFRKDCEIISGSVEFLYWMVNESALDYAAKMTTPQSNYASGSIKSAEYQLDPGVRCSMLYYNAPKYWEVRGQYTHLISRGKNSVAKPDKNNLFLTGTFPQVLSEPLHHAHSSIFFNYNLFSVSVDRVFIPNPHFRLRMTMGIETAWIRQDWKVQYFDVAHRSATIHNQWGYTAAGSRIGVSGDWYWGKDIYLSGLSSLGLFLGRYHNTSLETSDPLPHVVYDSDFIDTRPSCTVQFILGPSWQKNFCNARIELFTGYEIAVWHNIQEIHRSTKGNPEENKLLWLNTGAVSLQGLTTRLTVDF